MKELGDDGENTREVARACRALERLGHGSGYNARQRLARPPPPPPPPPPPGVHGARLRHEQAIDSPGSGEFAIALEVAGIAREILAGTELQWIDEDADDDTLGELAGAIHEAQMALVKVSHGGNETDRMGSRALSGRPRAHLGKAGELAQLELALLHLRKEVATLDIVIRALRRQRRVIAAPRFGLGLRRLGNVLLDQLGELFVVRLRHCVWSLEKDRKS